LIIILRAGCLFVSSGKFGFYRLNSQSQHTYSNLDGYSPHNVVSNIKPTASSIVGSYWLFTFLFHGH